MVEALAPAIHQSLLSGGKKWNQECNILSIYTAPYC
jgi:hypothetical protein